MQNFSDHFRHAHTDSVEDGEKLIQTALDAFGRIGEYCLCMAVYTYLRYCIIV